MRYTRIQEITQGIVVLENNPRNGPSAANACEVHINGRDSRNHVAPCKHSTEIDSLLDLAIREQRVAVCARR
ncbi:MAG: hypothetical protein ABIO49_04760 [Dokdonella sp.]